EVGQRVEQPLEREEEGRAAARAVGAEQLEVALRPADRERDVERQERGERGERQAEIRGRRERERGERREEAFGVEGAALAGEGGFGTAGSRGGHACELRDWVRERDP